LVDPSGISLLSTGNRALTSLDVSKNKLTRGALKAGKSGDCDSHYEIDMIGTTAAGCRNFLIPCISAGIIAVAGAVKDMEAILQFTCSGESFHDGSSWRDAPAVTMETSMTEADFSGQHLGVSGAIMLSAFLPKCM
jgi:hypothetical protein